MKPIFNTAKTVVYFLALFFLASFGTLNANNSTTMAPKEAKDLNAHNSTTVAPMEAQEMRWNRSLPWYSMIVIYGLPEEEHEVVMEKVADIGHKLGFNKYPLDDVVRAYRSQIPKSLIPKPIIVHMVNTTSVHKWAMAFNHRRLYLDHKEPWFVVVGLPKEPNMLRETAEDWARKRKFPAVWLDETNTTVFYRKNEKSPIIYQILDMNHMYHLLSDDFRYEVTWNPLTQRKKINIYEYVTPI
uniref:Uncharacterized protein n=1 Tax=Cacopsylla melanoneura TaxID=428564 RepID=A0A8D8M0H5_9HEMI